MATNPKIPTVQKFLGDNIPASLKAQRRWAPWEAVWNEKRQKMDKIPHHAKAPYYGLSTANPANWYSFEDAAKALTAAPGKFAGLGYVMTNPHGLVGVDLDDCVSAEKGIAQWAQQIVDDLASYTEISPSGNGLRIWTEGVNAQDYVDHDVGIEVYSGHEPRFLTVTGQRLATSPKAVTVPAAEVLPALAAKYMRVKATDTTVVGLRAPDVLDDLALPDIFDLDLNARARAFLEEGATRGDDSRELFAASVGLYAALQGEYQKDALDQIVYSILVNNEAAMTCALKHRKQDPARAEHYIWAHHCQRAGAKAAASSFNFDDFDDIDDAVVPDMAPAAKQKAVIDPLADFSTDDFDDESTADHAPAVAPAKFVFKQAAEYVKRKPAKWLIKRVLPQGTLGVLYGESGAGKSFFVLDMVLSIARGEDWQGHKVAQGSVAYICAEGAAGFSLRLQALAEHQGLNLADIPLYTLDAAPNFLEKQDIKDLLIALRAIPNLQLIVVDTLAQVTPGGDENSAVDMGKALAHCQVLSRKASKDGDKLVLLVAHSGKDATRGVRGWSGIKGALDVEILVERDKQKRSARISKIKDGVGENDIYPFELDSVVLGVDEDGDEITSCVIKLGEPTTQAAAASSHLKGDVQIAVMSQLEALCDFDGPVPADTLIKAVVETLPLDPTKADRRRDVVMRAIKALELAKRIALVAGMVAVVAA